MPVAGWPAGVDPPEAPEWQRSAAAWLADRCPPEYRAYPVLRRHPVVAARMAAHHVDAALAGARAGLATVRVELADLVPAHVVEEAVAVYEQEIARLIAERREVDLLERAFTGGRLRR
jgi:hypothetical protein